MNKLATTLVPIVLGLVMCVPRSAPAQPAGPAPRVGYVFVGTADGSRQNLEAFRSGLRELGHAEGRTLTLEVRYLEGRFDRVPEVLDELVRLRADVIVVGGYQLILAAKRATNVIPIVGVSCGVELLVQSLARPGGNVTGITCMTPDLATKQLQLLKEAVPGVARIAVLYNSDVPYTGGELRDLEAAAQALGMRLQALTVRTAGDLEPAFAAIARDRTQALFTVSDPLTYSHRHRIAELAIKQRVPGIFGFRDYCDAGGLICYGSNLQSLVRRAAAYVDRILKGARPADLPVEQPTKFDLVVNLKTARTLGLTLAPLLLLRADHVIPPP